MCWDVIRTGDWTATRMWFYIFIKRVYVHNVCWFPFYSIKCRAEKWTNKRDASANPNLLLFAILVAVAVIVAKAP